jgi:nucleotide-binding universal stress UspA family protein
MQQQFPSHDQRPAISPVRRDARAGQRHRRLAPAARGGAPRPEARLQRPRFLVAIDGSRQADLALQVAASLAHRLGGSLVLVHVVVPHPPGSCDSPLNAARAAEAAWDAGDLLLEDAAAAAGDVVITRELHGGAPADTICRRARELGADLVVVGSRGLGWLDRVVLGSVSSAVTQRAPCSVLVVRPRRTGACGQPAAPEGLP